MAYFNIDNLYKNQQILMMKECYALEKIHGTSSHLSYTPPFPLPADESVASPSRLAFFAGGGKYEVFVALFDAEAIRAKLDEIVPPNKKVHVYGEFYGGKIQKMSQTYGDKMKFVAFEVKIGDVWLNVPKAEDFCNKLGIEFVHYKRIPTTMEAIDAERDAPSEQAIRNGIGGSPHREGIVLRPIEEVVINNGKRLIAKHKRDEYKETATPRKVISEEKLKVIENAKAIANEWVTYERLNHILTKGAVEATIKNTGKVIALMTDDILREAEGEIVDSPDARKQIGRLTALMFKDYLRRGENY